MTITISKKEKKKYIEDCINIMGKIISDKEISFKASKNALLGIWGNLENVFISEVGKKKLFFCFKDQKKGMQILKRGSWSVRGHMINLQLWVQNTAINEVKHELMEFWI
ncbi:hypothetical protein AHAS_Ahas12G0166600 [Arachis hypogaea]